MLVHLPVTNKMVFTETLKYAAKRGHQKPEHFEGEPNDVLITTFNEKKVEQSGITLDIDNDRRRSRGAKHGFLDSPPIGAEVGVRGGEKAPHTNRRVGGTRLVKQQ